MNKTSRTKRRLVRLTGIMLAVAALAPGTGQAARDYPDGRVSLSRATAQPARDYPDGRVSLLTRSSGAVSSVAAPTTRLLAGGGEAFDWSDAGIGAASVLALVALLGGGAILMTRQRRALRTE